MENDLRQPPARIVLGSRSGEPAVVLENDACWFGAPEMNLMLDHTMQHFREVWYSQLFDRSSFNHWLENGSQDLGVRVRERTMALMDHQPAPRDQAALRSLDDMRRHWR